ncbi:MAG: thermonuclease family protein [Fimbriimonadales bacterium]|nr:thermonuclease family protein [Fimbriimonadales bacterium]
MRKLAPLLCAAVSLLAACSAPRPDEGRVVGVTDGDTLRVLVQDPTPREIRVRLHGIDAPERSQAFGSRARQELSKLVFGKTVRVEKVDTDRYGRTVARLFVDGTDVNAEMVRRGFAWWYRRYAPDDLELRRAEEAARASKVGLWRDRSPTPPWEFRAAERAR